MAKKINVVEHGKVRVLPVTCFLANYLDGHGDESVRLGFVLGSEIRFLSDSALSKPAQSWLRDDIMAALGIEAPVEKKDTREASLETQV